MSRPLKDPKGQAEKLVNAILKSLFKLQKMAFDGNLAEGDFEKINDAIQPELKDIQKKINLRKSLPNDDNPFTL